MLIHWDSDNSFQANHINDAFIMADGKLDIARLKRGKDGAVFGKGRRHPPRHGQVDLRS